MPKLTLNDLTSGYGLAAAYNANNALLEAALENTLSRDGTAPNAMGAQLDMNSHRIINVADGVNAQDAVSKAQLDAVLLNGGLTWGNIVGTLSDQTDLQAALDLKANASALSSYALASHTHEVDELDATGITDGYLLTADGAGNAVWEAPPAGSAIWGGITGTLSNQTDLNSALGGKVDKSGNASSITPGTTNTYSLGSSTLYWLDAYVSSIHLGNVDTTLARLSAGQIGAEGKAILTHAGSYTSGKITFSTSAATGGSNGDIHFQHAA